MNLELCFQRHLPLAWNVVGERSEDPARGSRTIDATIRIREVPVVQEVKRFRPELHAESFRDGESFEERHVHLPE